MGLFNIRIADVSDGELNAEFIGETVRRNGEPADAAVGAQPRKTVPVQVVLPDATVKEGLAEIGLMTEQVGSVIQFVRFGFGKVDHVVDGGMAVYFAHQ